MLQNLFRNMGPIVKNILLINVVLMIANFVFLSQGTNLNGILGAYYWESDYFEPYQILTHMFMHDNGGFMHILFNMFALVMFGSQLERVWGAKKFLIFYLACGFGAYALHNFVTYIEIHSALAAMADVGELDLFVQQGQEHLANGQNWLGDLGIYNAGLHVPMVGASGAIFGLLAGFAFLFPNTKLMLLFPPIPVKAKWFVLGYSALELYSGFQNSPSDSVAHFAHIGGALVSLIFLLIWQRKKDKFY